MVGTEGPMVPVTGKYEVRIQLEADSSFVTSLHPSDPKFAEQLNEAFYEPLREMFAAGRVDFKVSWEKIRTLVTEVPE